MSTRKRTRQSLLEASDEDELSPTKSKTLPTDVLGSTKRRRLNTRGSSPVSKSSSHNRPGILGSLKGLFGLSPDSGKENKESEEIDELSADVPMDKEGDDIWEVPEESDHDTSHKRRARAVPGGPLLKDTRPKDDEVLDIDNSELTGSKKNTPRAKRGPKTTPKPAQTDENEGVVMTPRRSAGRPKKDTKSGTKIPLKDVSGRIEDSEDEPSPLRRSSGRPGKSDLLREAKKLSREAIRKEMSRIEQHREENGTVPQSGQSKRRHKGITHTDTIVNDATTVSATRKRGRPKKEVEDYAGTASPGPKSILTPSKGRGVRPCKSVGFQGAEMDLGFRDIPNSSRKQHDELSMDFDDITVSEDKPDTQDSDVSDDDDVACVICNGLDSEEPNEILFCDNCDKAFHQLCYDVPVVPEGDWLCRDCRPDAGDFLGSVTNKGISTVETQVDIPDIEGFEDHLRCIQRVLLEKMTGQKRVKLTGHLEEMKKVSQVIEQTILAGEGNSMLVIGARGCGKTNLVETVITDISTEHREKFHIVRLNGFIHTDDKLALKEIWRQLGREMEVDDGMTMKSNHADTLASLLALLSHPSEISGNPNDQTAKSVVFILDEFDLFTTHSRQTLLYNLFDIAQARKAPIAVLGLTTRVDVVEALEKRVKSRFSHRYVHLSLPRNVPAFWDICKAGLTTDSDELEGASIDTSVEGLSEFISYWQDMIENLYDKDVSFKHHLQSHFYRTKSVAGFLTSCIIPIATLSSRNHRLSGHSFTACPLNLSAPDSKLHMLQGLSNLELALLIAAARLDIILDTDTCNFAMAYDEYSSLTSRHKIQTSSTGIAALGASAKVWGREVALGAWERLSNYNLLVPVGIGGGSARDFGAGGRMWKVDVGLEEISGSIEGISGVMAKWCREI